MFRIEIQWNCWSEDDKADSYVAARAALNEAEYGRESAGKRLAAFMYVSGE